MAGSARLRGAALACIDVPWRGASQRLGRRQHYRKPMLVGFQHQAGQRAAQTGAGVDADTVAAYHRLGLRRVAMHHHGREIALERQKGFADPQHVEPRLAAQRRRPGAARHARTGSRRRRASAAGRAGTPGAAPARRPPIRARGSATARPSFPATHRRRWPASSGAASALASAVNIISSWLPIRFTTRGPRPLGGARERLQQQSRPPRRCRGRDRRSRRGARSAPRRPAARPGPAAISRCMARSRSVQPCTSPTTYARNPSGSEAGAGPGSIMTRNVVRVALVSMHRGVLSGPRLPGAAARPIWPWRRRRGGLIGIAWMRSRPAD